MLESLRQRVIEALKAETAVTLSTNGPGGLQAGFFPCEMHDLTLYLLVPTASDVLFNLETEKAVIVTTSGWQLEGEAQVQAVSPALPPLRLLNSPRVEGCMLVAVCCRRIHFNWAEGWGYRETIDCNGR